MPLAVALHLSIPWRCQVAETDVEGAACANACMLLQNAGDRVLQPEPMPASNAKQDRPVCQPVSVNMLHLLGRDHGVQQPVKSRVSFCLSISHVRLKENIAGVLLHLPDCLQ